MHIFQNTYVLIATLAIGVVILVSISIYFALRGINVANGQTGRSFTSISNLERQFKRMGKARTSRLLLYINLSSDKTFVFNIIDFLIGFKIAFK